MSSASPSETPPAFRLERFLPYRLSVLAGRVSRRFATIYGERFGITIPEWRLLAHLSATQGASVREIYRRVDMDKPKVSRAAQRLEMLGFIAKDIDPHDRRLIRLALTPAGQDLFSEIEPLAKGFEADLFRALSPAERRQFDAVVDRLIHLMDGGEAATDGEADQQASRGRVPGGS